MPVIYFYIAVVLIGLFLFLKINLSLMRGHFSNLYALRKRGEAQKIITLEGGAYAWSIFWLAVFIIAWLYCAVMLIIKIDWLRIDVLVFLSIFTAYYIRQAITYMTAEFIKHRIG